MKYIKSETIELKASIDADFINDIIAFANSKGGTIYVGIDDEGDAVGLDGPESISSQIFEMIRKGIVHDLTSYTNIDIELVGDKSIVVVTIKEGDNKPYCVTENRLSPSGVYIRKGNKSIPASDEILIRMMGMSLSIKFEKTISDDQNLDLSDIIKRFSLVDIGLDNTKLKSFGFVTGDDNLYTNLAFLFSDKNTYKIKCAVYMDNTINEFADLKEFEGTIIEQFDQLQIYLNLINKTFGKITSTVRLDNKDYPDFAIKEACLNAVIHRSYDFKDAMIVHVHTDKIEVKSLGGLVGGLSIEDVLNGESARRNPLLAEIFRKLHYFEEYGTGIKRIIKEYEQYDVKPEFRSTTSTFFTILPNTNYSRFNPKNPLGLDSFKFDIHEKENIELIILHIKKNGIVSLKETEELLNLTKSKSVKLLKALLEKEVIRVVEVGRSQRYILNQ